MGILVHWHEQQIRAGFLGAASSPAPDSQVSDGVVQCPHSSLFLLLILKKQSHPKGWLSLKNSREGFQSQSEDLGVLFDFNRKRMYTFLNSYDNVGHNIEKVF